MYNIYYYSSSNIGTAVDDLPPDVSLSHYLREGGSPVHNAVVTQTHLTIRFENKWIGYSGPVAWPARSPDMTPLGYLLWGLSRQSIKNNHNTTEELQESVEAALNSDVLNDLTSPRSKCVMCTEQNGAQFEPLLISCFSLYFILLRFVLVLFSDIFLFP